MPSSNNIHRILWWGRFDPHYSRNRILREALLDLGFDIVDFRPKSSVTGGIEAKFKRFDQISAVWVPAFRQSDHKSAHNFAIKKKIPLIFDPLISAWDKAVFERKKYSSLSFRAKRLKAWEQHMFLTSDLVLADTNLHANFFIDELGADSNNTSVVPVGAEEQLFTEQEHNKTSDPLEVLFYGSFINLQGPEVIAEAASLVPEVKWVFLGDGPLRKMCEEKSKHLNNVSFEDWLPYEQLPARIGKADLLLGIFGSSRKAGRVIPNKLYQSIACGRPVLTRVSDAYPQELLSNTHSGINFVPPGNPREIANSVRAFAGMSESDQGSFCGRARKTYDKYFSKDIIAASLNKALNNIIL